MVDQNTQRVPVIIVLGMNGLMFSKRIFGYSNYNLNPKEAYF